MILILDPCRGPSTSWSRVIELSVGVWRFRVAAWSLARGRVFADVSGAATQPRRRRQTHPSACRERVDAGASESIESLPTPARAARAFPSERSRRSGSASIRASCPCVSRGWKSAGRIQRIGLATSDRGDPSDYRSRQRVGARSLRRAAQSSAAHPSRSAVCTLATNRTQSARAVRPRSRATRPAGTLILAACQSSMPVRPLSILGDSLYLRPQLGGRVDIVAEAM